MWFSLASQTAQPTGDDRRKSRRFPYPHRQPVAPVIDGVLPNQADFVEVLFRDISMEGFSFYSPNEFPAQQLVARLGSEPNTVYVLARMVHQKEVWHQDAWVYQVGCEILSKLTGRI